MNGVTFVTGGIGQSRIEAFRKTAPGVAHVGTAGAPASDLGFLRGIVLYPASYPV